MASHLRTPVVAIVSLIIMVPLLVWLRSLGLVLGNPWVLGLLLALVLFMALFITGAHARHQIGNGRLAYHPMTHFCLATAAVTACCWTAGWSLLVPAATILAAVPFLSHPSGRMWIACPLVVTLVTIAGQVGVMLGAVRTVVDPAQSHLSAGWLLVIAWTSSSIIARDTADQRLSADALARAEARLRALMESSTDILTVSGPDGALTYVSPAAERCMGYRPADLLGRTLLDLVDAEQRPAVAAWLKDLTVEGLNARASVDVLVIHSNLQRRWYEWTFHNLLDDALVQGMVVQQRDVSERLNAQRTLAYAATHDELTDLPNRGELLRQMALSVPQAGPGAGVAFLFIDLDLFKEVNDHLGHQAGDDVLVVVAYRLTAALRAHDHLGRIGGDEFGIVLTEVRDEAEVLSVVDRLVASLGRPITFSDTSVTIGASIGHALTNEPDTPLDDLLATADLRMYEKKKARRR